MYLNVRGVDWASYCGIIWFFILSPLNNHFIRPSKQRACVVMWLWSMGCEHNRNTTDVGSRPANGWGFMGIPSSIREDWIIGVELVTLNCISVIS